MGVPSYPSHRLWQAPESLVRVSMSIPGKPGLGVFEVALMLNQEVYRRSWGTLYKDLHVLFQNNPSLDLE